MSRKKIVWTNWIGLVLIFACLGATSVVANDGSEVLENGENQCKQEIEKVFLLFSRDYNKEKFTASFTSWVMENHVLGEALVTNFSRNHSDYKIENEFMTMYVDSTCHAIILRDSKVIIIRDNDGQEDQVGISTVGVTSDLQIDSILRYSEQISCIVNDGKGQITVDFKKSKQVELNNLKRMVLYYDMKLLKILKTDYDYYAGKGISRQTIEYSSYTTNQAGRIFNGTAVSQVLMGSRLQSQFSDYELNDLRKHE